MPPHTSLVPVEEALLEHVHTAMDVLSATVAGLAVEQVNTVPAPGTSSLAVLVAHTIETARSIAHDLANDPIPRDREAAFHIHDASSEDLQAMIVEWSTELDDLVRRAMWEPLDRPLMRYRQASRAWWLLQLLAHTREHAAHAALTRQLLGERAD